MITGLIHCTGTNYNLYNNQIYNLIDGFKARDDGYFEEDGTVVPVTVVGFREGNIVTQIKTLATDGYDAVQIGYRRVRDKKLTKPETGHLQKVGVTPMRHLQEFRLQTVEGFEMNQKLVFEEIFKEGDLVDVVGTMIGKGFQGGAASFQERSDDSWIEESSSLGIDRSWNYSGKGLQRQENAWKSGRNQDEDQEAEDSED